MISVKAHWEWWCRWNCDLRIINARKKAFLSYWKRRHHAQMPTMSLWAVAAKWPTRAPKTKLILCLRDPQGYSHISLTLWACQCQAGFWKSTGTSCQLRSKPHAVFHGVCEIVLTTQMGVMRRSKKVSSFELYKLNPLLPHCGSFAWELVHCYTWGVCELLQFAATQ